MSAVPGASINGDDPATRTVWNIVYTCVATTFACTWVSMHPNIPKNSRMRTSLISRVSLAVCALIAPEVIAYWAAVQWRAAHIYAKELKEFFPVETEWTLTHGFFLAMGGFIIPYEKQPDGTIMCRALPAHEFKYLLKNKLIEIPRLREVDIMDRSKGDPLAKGVAILQALWFGLQIMARFRLGLVISELEIITFALVPLNIVTYLFWMYKPLGVKLSAPVRWKMITDGEIMPSNAQMLTYTNESLRDPNDVPLVTPVLEDTSNTKTVGSTNPQVSTPNLPESPQPELPFMPVAPLTHDAERAQLDATIQTMQLYAYPHIAARHFYDTNYSPWLLFWKDEPDRIAYSQGPGPSVVLPAYQNLGPPPSSQSFLKYFEPMIEFWDKVPIPPKSFLELLALIFSVLIYIAVSIAILVMIIGLGAIVAIAFTFSFVGVVAIACCAVVFSPFIASSAFSAIGTDINTLFNQYRKLPMFYAPKLDDRSIFTMITISSILAMVFGGLHVLAWNFTFPTPIEHLLWRIASIALTGLPPLFLLWYTVYCYFKVPKRSELLNQAGPFMKSIVYGFTVITVILGPFAYYIARIYVLVAAFTALRSPVPGTLNVVTWAKFIPHI